MRTRHAQRRRCSSHSRGSCSNSSNISNNYTSPISRARARTDTPAFLHQRQHQYQRIRATATFPLLIRRRHTRAASGRRSAILSTAGKHPLTTRPGTHWEAAVRRRSLRRRITLPSEVWDLVVTNDTYRRPAKRQPDVSASFAVTGVIRARRSFSLRVKSEPLRSESSALDYLPPIYSLTLYR